jgi:hypothetical protein
MRARQNGGVIGPTNQTTANSASGIFSLVEAQLDKQNIAFPQYTIPAEPQFYLNSMLVHADGSNLANNNIILDSSSTNATVTRNGSTTQGTFSPFNLNGWSGSFNGSSDGLTLAGSSAFAFGTGDFTIEFWMRSTSGATSMNLIWMTSSWAIIVYSNSSIYYQSVQAVTNVIGGVSYGSLMDGNWHHVALCRASGQVRFFIDGTPIGTATTDNNNYTATNTVNIANIGGYGWFNGTMSNLRIVKGTAVYGVTNSFTPSTTPLTAISGTSLLTLQSNRFVDNSTNNYAITRVGAPFIQAYQPFAPTSAYGVSSVGGSIYFGGGTDTLSIADALALRLGTNIFTIEAWIYPTVGGTIQGITSKGAGTPTGWLFRVNASNQLEFLYGATIASGSGVGTVQINAWNHVVVMRDVANGIYFGLNGNLSASAVATVTNNFNQADPVTVGVSRGGSANPFTGYISNLRILNSTYQYGGSIIIPTAPFTASDAFGTAVLLLSGTNGAIYDNTGKNNLITGSSAGLNTGVSKFGGSSIYFGGTAAYCIYTAPSTATANPVNRPGDFGTNDFTVECWINPSASGGYQCIMTNRNSAGGAGTWFLGLYTGTTQVAWINAGTTTLNSTALTTGTWNHVAVSRASGTIRMFINGALTGTSSAADTTNYNASGLVSIGFDIVENAYPYTGYIDDFRISRYARYTTTFTAPTAPFLNQ